MITTYVSWLVSKEIRSLIAVLSHLYFAYNFLLVYYILSWVSLCWYQIGFYLKNWMEHLIAEVDFRTYFTCDMVVQYLMLSLELETFSSSKIVLFCFLLINYMECSVYYHTQYCSSVQLERLGFCMVFLLSSCRCLISD